jgi:hypothetical protein
MIEEPEEDYGIVLVKFLNSETDIVTEDKLKMITRRVLEVLYRDPADGVDNLKKFLNEDFDGQTKRTNAAASLPNASRKIKNLLIILQQMRILQTTLLGIDLFE